MTEEQFDAFITEIYGRINYHCPSEYEQTWNQVYERVISDAFDFAEKDEFEFFQKKGWI